MMIVSYLLALAIFVFVLIAASSNNNGTVNNNDHATIANRLSNSDSLRYDQLQRFLNNQSQLELLQKAIITPSTGEALLVFQDQSRLTTSYDNNNFDLAQKLAGLPIQIEINPLDTADGTDIWSFLPQIALIIIFIAILIFFLRNRNPQNKMTENKDIKISNPPNMRFNDIAGYDESIIEVKECLQFLLQPEKFLRLGARLPAGIILHGPPGTGKTLMAKALAGEARVPFFTASATQFVEMYVGVGPARIRDLFQQARRCPNGAVIFIDEIDAIGSERGNSAQQQSNDERESTLNELLVQLDGFNARDKIIVVAATNRADVLDPALLRPGRLSRQIKMPLPSEKERLEILSLHVQGKPLAHDVELESLASITAGSSGADLAEMVNEAALMAARENSRLIKEIHLQEGHLRALAGPERKESPIDQGERETIAYHEAGHVLCAELCDSHEKAQKVTIVPRGSGAAGLAVYGQRDRALHSTDLVEEKLACVLAGRAAEKVIFDKISSGAVNDLQKANSLARQAIEEFGFSPRAGQMITDPRLVTSEKRRAMLDEEIKTMVDDAYAKAIKILTIHETELRTIANKLLEQSTLTREEIVNSTGKIAHHKSNFSILTNNNNFDGKETEPALALRPSWKIRFIELKEKLKSKSPLDAFKK